VAWSSIGRVNYDLSKSETSNIKFRRSLYFINDIKKGSEITELDVASVRPGYGIAPKNFNLIIGKKVSRNILKNTAVQFSDICDL
jgi:N-acetylneuraminate synthase